MQSWVAYISSGCCHKDLFSTFDPTICWFTCLYWLYSIKYRLFVFSSKPDGQSSLGLMSHCQRGDVGSVLWLSVMPSSATHPLHSQVSIVFPPLVSHMWEEFSLTSEELLHYSVWPCL